MTERRNKQAFQRGDPNLSRIPYTLTQIKRELRYRLNMPSKAFQNGKDDIISAKTTLATHYFLTRFPFNAFIAWAAYEDVYLQIDPEERSSVNNRIWLIREPDEARRRFYINTNYRRVLMQEGPQQQHADILFLMLYAIFGNFRWFRFTTLGCFPKKGYKKKVNKFLAALSILTFEEIDDLDWKMMTTYDSEWVHKFLEDHHKFAKKYGDKFNEIELQKIL